MDRKNILITTGRAFPGLDLARCLHKKGHRVFVCDPGYFHACRFSNSIEKSFIVPAPRENSEGFIESVLEIVKENNIDLVIPLLEEILYLAKAKDRFAELVHLFCDDYGKILRLHNKWWFNSLLKDCGFLVPQSQILEKEIEKKLCSFSFPYILKESYSRASQGVYRIFSKEDLENVTFREKNPLMIQEFIVGKKYCSYSICQKGKVMAHTVYPVRHSISDSSCLTFTHIDHPKILNWVEKLINLIDFTGQICFDFIEKEDGSLYAIECNPRATSGLHLLIEEEGILEAFFKECSLILPSKSITKQIRFGMLIYGWRSGGLKEFLRIFFKAKDVLFSKEDIKPFIFQPFLFFFYLLKSLKLKKNLSQVFTHDFDYDGDENFSS